MLSITILIGHGSSTSVTVSTTTASSANASAFECGRRRWPIRRSRGGGEVERPCASLVWAINERVTFRVGTDLRLRHARQRDAGAVRHECRDAVQTFLPCSVTVRPAPVPHRSAEPDVAEVGFEPGSEASGEMLHTNRESVSSIHSCRPRMVPRKMRAWTRVVAVSTRSVVRCGQWFAGAPTWLG